tara:strand:+ start:562 stop:1506 length:945 start_codon:yes stop_codon:yes gene_type:complete
MHNNKKNRRFFLKNVSLSFLSFLTLPSLLNPLRASSKIGEPSCNASTEDAYGQGPFYTANAPIIENELLADKNETGVKIKIRGRVFNLDCTEVIPNTEIDIWHANTDGSYDNEGFNLRGKTFTNNDGFYAFESIMPGFYLNGSNYRPAHIHFKITPPNSDSLITQLYFENDPYISEDYAASMNEGVYDATNRIISLNENAEGDLEGVWDIVINGNGIPLATSSLHLEKGMIYKASPNPFSKFIQFEYGVFQKGKTELVIVNLDGTQIDIVVDEVQNPKRYFVQWEINQNLPSGTLLAILKINDLQVHHQKIIKS